MTVTFYRSTDGSAPTLNSNQGTLAAVLLAILVNGYGSTSAAGWTNPYNGTTGQKVFKQGSGSNGFYFQIDDSAANGTGAYPRVVGYETMSAWNTGTNPFPTATQQSGGLYVSRTSGGTAATTTRWACIADAKRFYFWNENDGSNNGSSAVQQFFCFGDIDTYQSGDVYATRIVANPAANNGQGAINLQQLTTSTSIYTCRNNAGVVGAISTGQHTDYIKSGNQGIMGGAGANGIAYPNPEDSSLYLTPVWAHDVTPNSQCALRGLVPGLWNPCHNATSFNSFDTSSGGTGLTSKTFTLFKLTASYCIAFETSNTWS
jgi:hypothetical protein